MPVLQSNINIKVKTLSVEKLPSDICGRFIFRIACSSVQSDLRATLSTDNSTETLQNIEWCSSKINLQIGDN